MNADSPDVLDGPPTDQALSSFFQALRSELWDDAQALLASDPRLGRGSTSHGETALLFSARLDHPQAVEFLLPHSDPRAQDAMGSTALMHAARSASCACARLLAPHSDPFQKDQLHFTALVHAVRWQRHASILLLAQMPTDPSERLRLQCEAFRVAFDHNQWDEVELFSSLLPPLVLRKQLFLEPNNFVSRTTLPRCYAVFERLALQQSLAATGPAAPVAPLYSIAAQESSDAHRNTQSLEPLEGSPAPTLYSPSSAPLRRRL